MRKKTFILSFLAVCAFAVGFFMPSQTANAESSNASVSKTFIYEISYNNGYVAKSLYSNNSQYSLSASRVEDLISQIDEDRYNLGVYSQCTLVFDDVTIGDDFMSLKNGEYIIQGTVTANALNTKGVFSLDGASVVFDNANLTNRGFSALIKNSGAGDIEINGGTYTADYNVIASMSNSSGDITITGGTFSSSTGYVLNINPSSQIQVDISETTSQTTIISSQSASILVENANITLNGGDYKNFGDGACVEALENANLLITGDANFRGEFHIKTQNSIDVDGYSGNELKILFNKHIANCEIGVLNVTDENKDCFTLLNDEYRFKKIGNNLTLNKVVKIIYNTEEGLELTEDMQEQMETEYFVGDVIPVHFFRIEVKEGYLFVGYSITEGGEATVTSPIYHTFIEEDLNLYPVFVAKSYNINYILGASDVDNSSNALNQSYTTGSNIDIQAPERPFYDFVGWMVDGQEEVLESYSITSEQFGDITLTAVWVLHNYEINYIGIEGLNTSNFKTSFTIRDEPLVVDYSKFLGDGYSLKTLSLDENFIDILEDGEEICFDTISRPNPDTLNIYINAPLFHNGNGMGTQKNPYIIETPNQFLALLEGQKSGNNQYLKLNNDIDFALNANIQKPLENIILDGNNKTIYFNSINKLNNSAGFIPNLKDCEFFDINFVSKNYDTTLLFSDTIYFGVVFGNVNNSILSNISVVHNNSSTICGLSETSMFYGSAVVGRAENGSVLNNVKITGDAIFDIYAVGDLNIYFGGIAGAVYNSLIINCEANSKLNLQTYLQDEENQSFIFTSGIANLWRDAKLYNCINIGGISSSELAYNRVISSAVANAFAEGVDVKNCYAVYENKLPNNIAISKYQTTWAPENKYIDAENVLYFDKNDRDLKNGKFVSVFNKKISDFNKEIKNYGYDCTLNTLYHSNTTPGFNQSILVKFKGMGVIDDKTVLYENITDLSNAFYPYTGDHFFEGWYLDKNFNKKAKLSNITGKSELTLYAKFTPITTVAGNYFTIIVVVDVILLAGLLVGMYFFDRKKPVRFYSNGKLISERAYGRTEIIELPEGYENTLWFEDVQGQKPFLNRKMSYKSLSLYTFNESKQKRMESKFYEKLKEENILREERERQRLEEEQKRAKEREEKRQEFMAQQKIRAEERKQLIEERRKQKQAQAEARQKEKLEAEAQKAQLETARKEAEARRKAQKEVDIDGKITVIKKEIKVIKPKKDE